MNIWSRSTARRAFTAGAETCGNIIDGSGDPEDGALKGETHFSCKAESLTRRASPPDIDHMLMREASMEEVTADRR